MDRVVIYNDAKKTNKAADSKGKCLHHRINKYGRCRPTIFNNDEYSICTVCGERFRVKYFNSDDIKTIINNMGLNIQNETTNNDDLIIDYFSKSTEMLQNYETKTEEFKNRIDRCMCLRNKIKNKNNTNSSSMYGSWGIRKDENGDIYE